MEKESIVLVGGGGHCKSCIDIIELDDRFIIAGILEKTDNVNAEILGYPVLGDDNLIESLANQGYNFLITVGQIRSTAIREKLYLRIKNAGGKLPVIVSPRAYVSKHAQIGEGTIVMHNVLINSCAKIGTCCILNTGSLVEHDATVGDFCHISTASVLNGSVIMGNRCFTGSNTVVNNNISVCDGVIIPSGIRVDKNIIKSGIFTKR